MTDERKIPLLKVENLAVSFFLDGRHVLRAVDDVNLEVGRGEIVGLVGESGSGKTVFALSVLRLVPPPGRIIAGRILWKGRDILKLTGREVRGVRGRHVAMIFQDPQAALNPVRTVGAQLGAVMRLHHGMKRNDARDEAVRLLRLVRIPDAERRLAQYPHEFSLGMCQRIMIAMALACRPDLLIADEPTASLDVTIQAQIMDLLLEVRERFGTSILLISHDLGVVASLCDRVGVMYLGRLIESGSARAVYSSPGHPYTEALLASVPVPEPGRRPAPPMPGEAPSPMEQMSGCRFRSRCPKAFDSCERVDPLLRPVDESGHAAACLLYEDASVAPAVVSEAMRRV